MASSGPPAASGSGSGNNHYSDSPPKYVPQFSAATEMILKRINSGATSSLSSIGITGTPPGYEDMKRNVLQGMKTSMNIELPFIPSTTRRRKPFQTGSAKESMSIPNKNAGSHSATPTGTPGGSASEGKKPIPKGRAGTKRKRAQDMESSEDSDGNMSKLGGDSDSDIEEGSIPDLPKITQSGRQVNKPAQFTPSTYDTPNKRRGPSRRAQEQALCKKCQRGHSPQNNMIVFCDGCNLGWHQQCHEPVVTEEAVEDETSQWFCADCSRRNGIKSGYETTAGVGWQGRSSEEKRAYLNSLPHPQLVSLLLQASVLHPNLPIFPPTSSGQLSQAQAYVPAPPRPSSTQPVRTNMHPQVPFPPSATSAAGLFKRVEANPSAPINFIRKIHPGQSGATSTPTPPSSAVPAFTHPLSAPPQLAVVHHTDLKAENENENDQSRESTPASPPYPKAGNGLMAKLGPDEDDMEWLVDDNDYKSIRHVVYNERGETIEDNFVMEDDDVMEDNSVSVMLGMGDNSVSVMEDNGVSVMENNGLSANGSLLS